MAPEVWYRRLTIALRRAGEQSSTRLVDVADASVRFVSPISVHLRAGELARKIPITADYDSASPKNSYVLLATNNPGVVARIDREGTSSTCRSSGILASSTAGVFSVVQTGAVTPTFEVGKWQEHAAGSSASYNKQHAAEVADSNFDHNVLECDSGTQVQCQLRHMLGYGNHFDLGEPNDGKIIQFLFKAPTTNLVAKIQFNSWGHGADVHDSDVSTPVPTDAPGVWLQSLGVTPYFENTFTTKVVNNTWTLITLRKNDFTAFADGTLGAPLWSRITQFFISATWSPTTGNKFHAAAFYFGDPPEYKINSFACIPWQAAQNNPAVLSLDAPSGTDAHVEGVVALL